MLAAERAPSAFEFALSRQGEDPLVLRASASNTDKTPPRRQDLVSLARRILETSKDDNEVLGLGTINLGTMDEPGSAVAESPTARFTAVNGKDQATSGTGNEGSRRGSDERGNGQPRVAPPGQEKLKITTTPSQREDWSVSANGEPNVPDRQSYQPQEGESSHKRKRSESTEQNSSSGNTYLHPSAKETPTTASTDSDVRREENLSASQSASRDYAPEAQYRQFIASADEGRDATSEAEHWQQRQYPLQTPVDSDEHLGQVLQRASQSMDPQGHQYRQISPDDRSINPYGYGTDRREISVQSDPKKRKRNFSNRTKTGCMTCRRRKKKCDENRPECKCPFTDLERNVSGLIAKVRNRPVSLIYLGR